MNLLGKILTLLIFVMSLMFMFVAFMVAASHQNWKEQAEANRQLADQRLENQKTIQQSITKYQKDLEKEKVVRMLLVQQLSSQLQSAQADADAAQKSLVELEAALNTASSELRTAQARLAEQDVINSSLDEQNRKLIDQVAAENEKLIELQSAVFAARSQVAQLEKLRTSLANSYAKAIAVLNKVGKTEDSLLDDEPPALDGIVTSVDNKTIVVSLGKDDGLLKGHVVDIFRKGQFKGQGTVSQSGNNKSIVRLNPRLSGNSAIQVGDSVTTSWSRNVAGNNGGN